MATYLHHVLSNFYWRIEAIDPTYEGRAVGRFRQWDPNIGLDPAKGSGWTRRFWVEWNGSGIDNDAAAVLRESDHTFTVHVLYQQQQPHREVMEMIALDRHDLVKTLRGQIPTDHRKGYDDDNPTTNIGLMSRRRSGDDLRPFDPNPRIWEYRIEFTCTVREDET